MRTLWLFRIVYVTTVLMSTCPISVWAQQSPEKDAGIAMTGPNSGEADYRYLSLATLRASGGPYDFEYNLCNLREKKMAFYWEDVGFGMDVSDPLPSGLCATYERTGTGRKLEPKTTLKFSPGSQSPPAYLPCDGENECVSKSSPLQSLVVSLRAFVIKHLDGAPQPNRPTSVVLPLRVVVRSSDQGGAKEVQVDWAGTGVKFVAYFANSEFGADELKQLINPKIGRFEFETFPAFNDNSRLLLAERSKAALTVSSGDTITSGTFIFQISEKFPPTRKVIFLVVDKSGQPLARIDAPLPKTPR
jgi:hypothetical protein